MPQNMRFGRKVQLPSTRQIRHELLVLMQEEARRRDTAVGSPPAAGSLNEFAPAAEPGGSLTPLP